MYIVKFTLTNDLTLSMCSLILAALLGEEPIEVWVTITISAHNNDNTPVGVFVLFCVTVGEGAALLRLKLLVSLR